MKDAIVKNGVFFVAPQVYCRAGLTGLAARELGEAAGFPAAAAGKEEVTVVVVVVVVVVAVAIGAGAAAGMGAGFAAEGRTGAPGRATAVAAGEDDEVLVLPAVAGRAPRMLRIGEVTVGLGVAPPPEERTL